MLRAAKEEDGQVIFTFLFYGGEAAEWQMEPILAQALGAEGARRALEDMGETQAVASPTDQGARVSVAWLSRRRSAARHVPPGRRLFLTHRLRFGASG